MTSEPHPFFVVLLERVLKLDAKITKRLWATLYPTELHGLILQADFVWGSTGSQGVELLAKRLSPQLLISACLRLAPENGQRRDRGVLEAEERILQRVGRDGQWA